MTTPKLDEAALFNAARRIESPAARQLYLRQACGEDAQLLARLEALLRVHDQTHGVLESPTEELRAVIQAHEAPASAGVAQPTEAPTLASGEPAVLHVGTKVRYFGDYELLEEISRGGMGVVYKARQISLNRILALKMILAGEFASAADRQRFHTEAEAAASLDHPNIVPIYEVGEYAGQQYFSMKLIDGRSLDRELRGGRQTADTSAGQQRAARLIAAVARAVHYAHQRGILHRDLKPGNLLIDGQGQPHVADFGLAKRAKACVGSGGALTHSGAILGTPSYMAPEQARAERTLTTAVDVYSLGAVFYDLLTGRPPFQAETPLETVLQVQERDPQRPRALQPDIARDLEIICLKCLEKEPAKRYGSAGALAEDLERWIGGSPIEARPSSVGERVLKWAKRRPAVASLLAVLAVVLPGSLLGLTGLWLRAEEQRAAAVAEKQRADDEAAIARAVNEFLQNDLLGQADISNQEQSGGRNRAITVRELLDRAARRIDVQFQGQERTEAALRLTLGKAYEALGEYPEAQRHLERSRNLREQLLGDHPDTWQSSNSLGALYLARGQYDQAEPILKQTLESRRARLGRAHPDTLDSMDNLGALLIYRGRFDEAECLYKEIVELRCVRSGPDEPNLLESMNNLAVVYLYGGRFGEAEPLLKQVRQGFRARLGPDHPRTLTCTNNLASCYMELNRYGEAEPLYQEVLDIRRAKLGPDHPATLFSMNFVGLALKQRGKYQEAEPLLKQVLEGRLAKLGPDHVDTLTSECNLASVLAARGRYQEAEPLFKKALAASRAKLGPNHPETLHTLSDVAGFYQDRGRLDQAERLFQEAVTGATKELGLSHPQTHIYIDNLADVHNARRKPELSEQPLRELVAFLREKSGADSAVYAGQLARLGQNLLAQKRYAEAGSLVRDSLAVLTKKEPDAWTTFDAQSLLGGALVGQGKYAEAEPLLVQGYDGLQVRRTRISASARFHLLEALERLVRLYKAWSKPAQAAQWRGKLAAEKIGPPGGASLLASQAQPIARPAPPEKPKKQE